MGANLAVIRDNIAVVATMVGGEQRCVTGLKSNVTLDELRKAIAHEFGFPAMEVQLLNREGTVLFEKPGVSFDIQDRVDFIRVLPSKGSALHEAGVCKPCAWFFKPKGCANGVECLHCHSCPEGEIQRRKKAKVAAIRMAEAASKDITTPQLRLVPNMSDSTDTHMSLSASSSMKKSFGDRAFDVTPPNSEMYEYNSTRDETFLALKMAKQTAAIAGDEDEVRRLEIEMFGLENAQKLENEELKRRFAQLQAENAKLHAEKRLNETQNERLAPDQDFSNAFNHALNPAFAAPSAESGQAVRELRELRELSFGLKRGHYLDEM